MAMDNDDVISVLNNLIETCEDGVKGFRDAAEAIGNPRAREVFNSRIDLIERAESDLKAAVRRLGGDPEDRGSATGAMHRGWMNLKAAITGKNDEARREVLRSLEEAPRFQEAHRLLLELVEPETKTKARSR